MREIEIKILGISKGEFLAKMKKIKAKKIFEGLMKVLYWDFEDGRIKKKGELLRTRERGNGGTREWGNGGTREWGNESVQTEVVFKKKKENLKGLKQREEIEVIVEGGEKVKEIFENLGLKISKNYEKKRMEFKAGGLKFDFDEYPNGFCYLEMEGKNPDKIKKMIRTLGWEDKEKTAETADKLFDRIFGKGRRRKSAKREKSAKRGEREKSEERRAEGSRSGQK